jgi:tRNA G18 (ribose-2'-O)-methylase SpoU
MKRKKTLQKITSNCQRRELLVFQHSFQNVFERGACSIFFVVETKKKRMGEVRKQKKRKKKRRGVGESLMKTKNKQTTHRRKSGVLKAEKNEAEKELL